MAAPRVVTRGGSVSIRGKVAGRIERLTVDGREVTPDDSGAFARDVSATEDRLVPVVAVSATGLRRTVSVEIVVDSDPPAVATQSANNVAAPRSPRNPFACFTASAPSL